MRLGHGTEWAAGVNLTTVQTMLGPYPATTTAYLHVHVAGDAQQAAAARLDGVLRHLSGAQIAP